MPPPLPLAELPATVQLIIVSVDPPREFRMAPPNKALLSVRVQLVRVARPELSMPAPNVTELWSTVQPTSDNVPELLRPPPFPPLIVSPDSSADPKTSITRLELLPRTVRPAAGPVTVV